MIEKRDERAGVGMWIVYEFWFVLAQIPNSDVTTVNRDGEILSVGTER